MNAGVRRAEEQRHERRGIDAHCGVIGAHRGFATRQALDEFLKAHEVYLSYTVEDLERDRSDLRRAGF
jgi:hypothetical protein